MVALPCLLEGEPEREPDILDRVVAVDFDVSAGLDGEIEEAVAREGVEHVVEERERRVRLALTRAVDEELEIDLRLGGVAGDGGSARAHGQLVITRPGSGRTSAPWRGGTAT
jgi:hypothetical protein